MFETNRIYQGIQLQIAREKRYCDVGQKIAENVKSLIEAVSRESLIDVEELFAWREWANRLLYGELGCQHPNYSSGVDGDKRGWLEDRLWAPDERLLKRVSELEREILTLRAVLRHP